MSSDGCPGEREHGWYTGYINFTTTIPFQELEKYLPFCGKGFNDSSFIALSGEESRNWKSGLLRILDKYTLKLNFCYKSRDDVTKSRTSWPKGNYSVYSTADGCPSGTY